MYDDSWYSYVPSSLKKEDEPQTKKHRRRESLLKQTNGNDQIIDQPEPILELFEDKPALKSPPKATLAKRAKSYSDFYEVATKCLTNEAKVNKPKDVLEYFPIKESKSMTGVRFEDVENELLAASNQEYQLYYDQLASSEQHLDNLLQDTTSALDLLATLSESFKAVETETTAFQAQCEDLLAEQKRLRDLADEIGTDLQYYAYLEPLTRRLNAPGAGRLVKNDDFLDMLVNLNTCIEFMDEHPTYRDSLIYKTRYTSLLERSLNLVLVAFQSAFYEVTDQVVKQLNSKEGQSETAEYIMLYGKYETIVSDLGIQIEKLLRTDEFAFGREGDDKNYSSYASQYHQLYKPLSDAYLKSREPVNTAVLKSLQKFARVEKADTDFQSFARRCIQYVLDICHNEQNLINRCFLGGPLLVEYDSSEPWNTYAKYSDNLWESSISHLATLHNFILPYLLRGGLERISGLIDWLENIYMAKIEGEEDEDLEGERKPIELILLSEYFWPSLDSFLKQAAIEIGNYKPSQDDLRVTARPTTSSSQASKSTSTVGSEVGSRLEEGNSSAISNAFPTVQKAVKLLVMYNDGCYERPRNGDVLYEIVHQTTESLQKAATTIKRNSTIMEAQLFLMKNLLLIENLFLMKEIPETIRQSAEFDFTPIWDTIKELQDRKQLFNPLAYIRPLVKGRLLPAVVDRLLDARKELEKVLVQQITAFTKDWQILLKDPKKSKAKALELDALLNRVFEDDTTRAALWKMIRADE